MESKFAQIFYFMHLVDIHHVRIRVFDNYQRCPMPLMNLPIVVEKVFKLPSTASCDGFLKLLAEVESSLNVRAFQDKKKQECIWAV